MNVLVGSGSRMALGPILLSGFRLTHPYSRSMFTEKNHEENPDLDAIGPARPGEHPTDPGPTWMPGELHRWYLASKRSFHRRKAAALERARQRKRS